MASRLTARMLAIATTQHGVVASHQARCHGSRHEAQYELSQSHWRCEAPQVYGVAGAPVTPRYRAMVSLLRAGPGAVVSHESALWVWGVLPEQKPPFHVTKMRAANGKHLRGDGIFAHETRKMPDSHVTTHDGFSIVVPARALADAAASTPMGRIERWLDRAWMLRLVDYGTLSTVLNDLNKRGRRGVRPLRSLVEKRGPEHVPPESGLEGRLSRLLEKADLPAVRRQVEVGGQRWLGRVDFRVGKSPVVVEVQSDTYHASLTSKDDDRRRSRAMADAGFVVVPIWESVVWQDPARAVELVSGALRDAHR